MKKSLAINSIFNILYKMVAAIYPLVSAIYVSHILESDRVGAVSYAQNIVSYFVLLASVGIPSFGVRGIAKCKTPEERNKLFNTLFWLNALTTAISIVLYGTLVVSVPLFRENYILYMIAGIQLVFSFFNVDWLFEGMEEYRYISIRSIIIKLLALAALFVFIHEKDDYIIYALIFCVAIGGNNILNIIRSRKYVVLSFKDVNIFEYIKPIMILFVASLAIELYTMIDTTMLGFFCEDSSVGCYSNAIKLTRMVISFCAAIGAILLPRLSVIYEEGNMDLFKRLLNTALQMMLFFAIPAAIGLFLLSDRVIPLLYGDTFDEAIPILKILSLMIPVVVMNTLVGVQLFVSTNRENKYTVCVVCGAIVNVILNSILIPLRGATAAAVASFISEVVVFAMYLILSRKIYTLKLGIGFIISMVTSMAAYILLFYFVLNRIELGDIVFILMNIGCCLAILGIFSLIFKNESVYLIINRFFRRHRAVEEPKQETTTEENANDAYFDDEKFE